MVQRSLVTMVVAAGLVLSLAVQSARADGPKGTASIKGKVTVEGDQTPPKTLPSQNADPFCAKANPKAVPDQATIVYTKLGNALPYSFVYIKNIKDKYDAPATPAVLDQQGCSYHPHVFGMVAGQQLDIKNSDATAHNIHSLPKKNQEFNVAQPNVGVMQRKAKDTFTKPEMAIKIKCDVHNWMSAWCHVMTHPFFAVTKSHEDTKVDAERGTYEIKDLPAGEYEVVAWHERFGEMTSKVTVKDGEAKELNLVFKKDAKAAMAVEPSREVLASVVTGPAPATDDAAAAKPACCAKKTAK